MSEEDGATPTEPTPTTGTEPQPTTPNTDRGYPEGVPLADMAETEQLAYWKHQSRKHEAAAKAAPRADELRELRAAKQKLDQVVAEQMTEQEKAVAAARDEGRQSALTEASTSAVASIFEVTFLDQGMSPEDVQEVTRPLSLGAFVTDGVPDVAAIRAYAARLGGKPVVANPDLGQGKRGNGAGALRSGEDILKQFNI